jgi:hypothetical protein
MKVKKIVYINNKEILFICKKSMYKYTVFIDLDLSIDSRKSESYYKIIKGTLYYKLLFSDKKYEKNIYVNQFEKISKKEYYNYLKYII